MRATHLFHAFHAATLAAATLALVAQPSGEADPADRAGQRQAAEQLDDLFDDAPTVAPADVLPQDRPRYDAAPGVAPDAPRVELLREGTFLVDRVGRLDRGGDAALPELLLDADGRGLRDPPLRVLPNLKLMEMEKALDASGSDLQFRVTGELTEYRGRNYILLQKVIVLR